MSETSLHLTVVELIRFHAVRGLIYYHPVNEGRRSPRTGAFLKRLGMLTGVSDLALVMPGGRAAFLELKAAKGRLTAEQRAFRSLCELNGTPFATAKTPEEAAEILFGWGAISSNPLARRKAA